MEQAENVLSKKVLETELILTSEQTISEDPSLILSAQPPPKIAILSEHNY
jgi:hypothetical protein